MDLTTTYLGLKLKNPLVPSASPLARKLDSVKRLEDAGAAAITLYSFFEEQVKFDAEELSYFLERGTEAFPEALTYYPESATPFHAGPEEYLNHVARLKEAVEVPVIASLNASTVGGWVDYAKKIQQAGADALELNLYLLATDPKVSGAQVEQLYLDVLKAVKASVKIPVAMKLSPYFSSLANLAAQLDAAGADGLVLFNRFYQPVIDTESLEVRPDLVLSTPLESRLPLRWVAILYGRVKASLALTSGIHDSGGVVQAILAGASAVNVCSALLEAGPQKLAELLGGLQRWMTEHRYQSVDKMRGTMSQKSCPDPQAFERANYMRTLGSYQ